MQPFWETAYKDLNTPTFGGPSQEIRDIVPLLRPGAKVLDLGCGLHLVERDSWQRLIRLFKAHTNPGGFNAVTVFTDRIPPPDDLKDLCIGLFREGEIFSLYSDWEVMLQQSYTLEDDHPGSCPHVHPINKLVATKPSN